MNLLDFREPVSAWTHFLWMLAALPATALLCWRARGDRLKQLSLLVYGLGLVFCFGASAFFHGVRSPGWVEPLNTLDHIGIYLLIAGTYTPPSVVLLRGRWRSGVLALSWSLALAGIVLELAAPDLSLFLSTALYLGLGWGGVLCYFELARTLSHRALLSLVAGGLLYSLGAAFNLSAWPDFRPGVFGPHELFHVFVMAGSLCHFVFMLTFVVPFQRRDTNGPVLPPSPSWVRRRERSQSSPAS